MTLNIPYIVYSDKNSGDINDSDLIYVYIPNAYINGFMGIPHRWCTKKVWFVL